MEFEPKTEQEIAEANLIPKGEYPFEIIEAVDTKSKQGNSMIKIVNGVFLPSGKMRKVVDYLVTKMEFKLRHFCDCVGLLPQYQNGTLCANDCRGRTGTCRIDIKPATDGYPPKAEIKDYVIRPAKPLGEQEPDPAKVPDDDLPF